MTTESKFTPGPWTVVQAEGSRSGTYRGNYEIAEATDEEHDANTHLIAAAPELVAALQGLLKLERNCDDGDPRLESARKAARAALDKAGVKS